MEQLKKDIRALNKYKKEQEEIALPPIVHRALYNAAEKIKSDKLLDKLGVGDTDTDESITTGLDHLLVDGDLNGFISDLGLERYQLLGIYKDEKDPRIEEGNKKIDDILLEFYGKIKSLIKKEEEEEIKEWFYAYLHQDFPLEEGCGGTPITKGESDKENKQIDNSEAKDLEMDDDLQSELDEAIDADVNLDEKEMTSKKTGKKLKASAAVRNRGKVVFSAEKSKDKKDHFPINNAAQARNALARSQQYKSAPKWYGGSLSSLQSAVKRAVKKAYPSIKVSESLNESSGPRPFIDGSRDTDLLRKLLRRG